MSSDVWDCELWTVRWGTGNGRMGLLEWDYWNMGMGLTVWKRRSVGLNRNQ